MPITVACPQGHKLTAQEKLAGKRVKCPKCGAVVQIPAMELSESGEGLILDTLVDPSLPEDDWQSSDPTGHTDLDDPLGWGQDWGTADPLAVTGSPTLVSPAGPQAGLPYLSSSPMVSKQPEAKPATAPSKPAATLSLPGIIGLASGGAVIGLVFVGFVAWWLFGGSRDQELAEASQDRGSAVVATAPPGSPVPVASPNAPLPAEPTVSPVETVSAVETVESQPAAPVRQPQPWDLTRIQLDKRLDGFKLPAATWAAAYDQVTGRLAITHDEQGILIYDLDEVLKGNPEPAAKLPTKGLPTAICLKPLSDRRVFVIAGQDEPHLQLVDAESLEPVGKTELSTWKFIDFLAGSLDPNDPFVYFSTSDHEDYNLANRLGRVNLITGQQDAHTKQRFADITVSPDGQRLFARPDSTGNGVTANWTELVNYNGDPIRSPIANWDRRYTPSPPVSLGYVVAINNAIFNPTMNVYMARLDYSPQAALRKRPVLVGLGQGELVFGSANDYRRLASIPLPPQWFVTERWAPADDFRLRPQLAPNVRTAFLETHADESRQVALIVLSEHLVIAPLDRVHLPAEPSLIVRTPLPEQVTTDTAVELELALETAVEGVEFEYVPNTDWLPNEKTPLLGNLPPGVPSPSPFELGFGVGAEQSFVMLKSYEPLKGIKLPFNLRIGNEVMRAVKYEKTKIIVERTQPVAHGFSERIAVVDDDGRMVSTMAATMAATEKPPGKRLGLAAAVNSQQTTIFVSDLRPLSGETLPLNIQIGDERMVVTGVDDFKTALTVQRTEPANHGVSSDVWLLEDPESAVSQTPSLPVVSGHTLRWTPTVEQLGTQTIRLRAKLGKVAHEWFWQVTVARGMAALPFQVVGIEANPETDTAIIWGQAFLPYLNPPATAREEANTYFVGIYDLAEKKLLRHVEVPKPIMAATLDATGVYASFIAFDIEPKADRQAENARERASRQITPTEIVRLDVETLKIEDRVSIPEHCHRLQIIAGKYLAAFDRWRSGTLRFNIPDLSPVEPSVPGYEYPIAGRLRDGWVWDGVVWDEPMTKPRLLLFPVHFEQPPGAHMEPQMVAAAGGTIYMRAQGPYVGTWCPGNAQLPGGFILTNQPASLSCTGGFLHAHSWAAPSLPRVGATPKPTSVRLMDLSGVTIAGDPSTREQRTVGYVSEADGQVHVALLGKLYSVELEPLVRQEDAFRFIEQQEQFVLPADQPARLTYNAPGAVSYQLQLWHQRPHFHDEEPNIAAQSLDGTFDLAAEAFPARSDQPTEAYLKRITPVFERLTGRKPVGFVYPVYVSVIADHQDGQQKAGLAHAYLIEVPRKRS